MIFCKVRAIILSNFFHGTFSLKLPFPPASLSAVRETLFYDYRERLQKRPVRRHRVRRPRLLGVLGANQPPIAAQIAHAATCDARKVAIFDV